MSTMKRLALALVLLLVVPLAATAITVTVDLKTVFGDQLISFGRVTFDTSYPTGGETATPSTLSGTQIQTAKWCDLAPHLGYVPEYDITNSKILVYQSAALATHTHSVTATQTAHSHAVSGSTGSHSHDVTGTTDGHTHTVTITNGVAGTAMTYNNGTINVSGTTANLTIPSATDALTGITSGTATATVSITSGTTAPAISASTAADGSVAAGALTQVPNATNLSALTNVRYFLIGSPL